MRVDRTRVAWIEQVLEANNLDVLIASLPENVLLLSGYWPMVGTAVALVTQAGSFVLAPDDERDLATHGFANEVRTYHPGSLSSLALPAQTVRRPLGAFLADLGVAGGRIGYDDASIFEESSYSAMYLFQASMYSILQEVAPQASLRSGAHAIARLRERLTSREVDQVRQACVVAGEAFVNASPAIRAGQREPEVATAFRSPIEIRGLALPNAQRAGAFTWCMSGPNAALAGAAYARTRNRELAPGDLVLVHCNSYLNGYWTDITRTYVLGNPDDRQRAMYEAIFAARTAALDAIRPGAPAATVDAAARRALSERGFGQYFTHGVGHNVGFSAISAEFPPRLHPGSPDVLEVGMTFNIEPSIYIEGYGGLRHCDVVTLGADGPEVLTPFQATLEELIVGRGEHGTGRSERVGTRK